MQTKIFIFLGVIILIASGLIGYKYYDTTQQTISHNDSLISHLQKINQIDKEEKIKNEKEKIDAKVKLEREKKEEQIKRDKAIEDAKYLKGYGKKWYRFYEDFNNNFTSYYYDKENVTYYTDGDVEVYVKFVFINQIGNTVEAYPVKLMLSCKLNEQLRSNNQYIKEKWYMILLQLFCK